MSKIVGKVTVEEKNEIEELYDKKIALENLILLPSIIENEVLYNKAIGDYTRIFKEFNEWWALMGKKYNWESSEDGSWGIDFETCEITLEFRKL